MLKEIYVLVSLLMENHLESSSCINGLVAPLAVTICLNSDCIITYYLNELVAHKLVIGMLKEFFFSILQLTYCHPKIQRTTVNLIGLEQEKNIISGL